MNLLFFLFILSLIWQSILKVSKQSISYGVNELSRFSDTAKDASLDDLFQPLDKQRDQGLEASSSAAGQQTDLAKELKARMAQKQMGAMQNNGGKLLEMVMGLHNDVIDIDGSVSLESVCELLSSSLTNLYILYIVLEFWEGSICLLIVVAL